MLIFLWYFLKSACILHYKDLGTQLEIYPSIHANYEIATLISPYFYPKKEESK